MRHSPLGLIAGIGITLVACHSAQPAPPPHRDAETTVHATSSGSAVAPHVASSTGVLREAVLHSTATALPSSTALPSTTVRANQSAPKPLPAVDSACLSEFKRALPDLPACKTYFQSWMAAFSDASAAKAWKRWAEFVLPGTGLLIDNTYEVSHSDPGSTGSSHSATIPHAAFLDGTALQRFEQLDLRGGLRCIEDDEVWCPGLLCRPYGATQIACSNQGGGDPFQYRWTLRQGNWYLTEIYQTWPN